MSYYTDYSIDVVQTDPKTHAPLPPPCPMNKNLFVPQEVIDFFKQDHIKLAFNHINTFEGLSQWYDWEKELMELSKNHPGLMFIVEGKGEGYDDTWIAWITDGLSQYEKKYITHNPFDIHALTPEPKT